MNEQIKELILNAGWKNAYTNPKEGFELVFENEDHNLACIEKFAELIVRECIAVCKSRVGNSDYNTGRMHCVSDIKEHFGVK